MDYTEILKTLRDANSFDLFRLNVAIQNQLNDPTNLAAIKNQLTIDQAVEFFDPETNLLVQARVEKISRTKVCVAVDANGERWTIPLYWLNLNNSDTKIGTMHGHNRVDRNCLKVADRVGYRSKQGVDVYGKVLRLNQKSATVELSDGEQWRVSYSLLFSVVDGEGSIQDTGSGLLIEGNVQQ